MHSDTFTNSWYLKKKDTLTIFTILETTGSRPVLCSTPGSKTFLWLTKQRRGVDFIVFEKFFELCCESSILGYITGGRMRRFQSARLWLTKKKIKISYILIYLFINIKIEFQSIKKKYYKQQSLIHKYAIKYYKCVLHQSGRAFCRQAPRGKFIFFKLIVRGVSHILIQIHINRI